MSVRNEEFIGMNAANGMGDRLKNASLVNTLKFEACVLCFVEEPDFQFCRARVKHTHDHT